MESVVRENRITEFRTITVTPTTSIFQRDIFLAKSHYSSWQKYVIEMISKNDIVKIQKNNRFFLLTFPNFKSYEI